MFRRRDVEAELGLDLPDVRRYLLLDGIEQCLGLEGRQRRGALKMKEGHIMGSF